LLLRFIPYFIAAFSKASARSFLSDVGNPPLGFGLGLYAGAGWFFKHLSDGHVFDIRRGVGMIVF
jgi:hypothetical protein